MKEVADEAASTAPPAVVEVTGLAPVGRWMESRTLHCATPVRSGTQVLD